MPIQFDFGSLAQDFAVKYPVFEESKNTDGVLERIQVQYSETQFGFILRHPGKGHWCGYVLVTQYDWLDDEFYCMLVNEIPVSYIRPSNSQICWMEPNLSGRLTKPVLLTPNVEDDFWIGFDFLDQERTPQQVLDTLHVFSVGVWSRINDRLSSGR